MPFSNLGDVTGLILLNERPFLVCLSGGVRQNNLLCSFGERHDLGENTLSNERVTLIA